METKRKKWGENQGTCGVLKTTKWDEPSDLSFFDTDSVMAVVGSQSNSMVSTAEDRKPFRSKAG